MTGIKRTELVTVVFEEVEIWIYIQSLICHSKSKQGRTPWGVWKSVGI